MSKDQETDSSLLPPHSDGEGGASKRLAKLGLLSTFALELASLPDNANVYLWLARALRQLAGGGTVATATRCDDGTFRIREVACDLPRNELGKLPAITLSNELLANSGGAELVELDGGLGACVDGGSCPESWASVLCPPGARTLLLGLAVDKVIRAAVLLIKTTDLEPAQRLLIQTAARQASMTLQRSDLAMSLAESERKFRMLTEQSLMAIAVLQDGRVTYVNQEVARVLGHDLTGWPESAFGALIHPDDRAFALEQARLKQRGEEGVVTRYEYRVFDSRGQMHWLDQFSRSIDFEGRPADLVCFIDITERKQAESVRAELEVQRQKTRTMDALTTLAGGVAHEFNNLLMTIMGASSLIKLDAPAESVSQDQAGTIDRVAKRARALVQQLLVFARDEEPASAPVKLEEIAQRALDLLPSHDTVQIDVDTAPGSIVVAGDVNQLTEVVRQLLCNACDAVHTGGMVHLSTRFERVPTSTHGLAPGMYGVLRVRDTGRGMSERVKARAFEPFFTTKGFATSSGMGLAVVFEVIRKHHGTVRVESKEGSGTVFDIFIPTTHGAEQCDPASPAGPHTVLVVDDDELIRSMLRQMLELQGCEVLEARDGQEGIEVFEAHADDVDLVILDMVMPRLDGAECYAALKSRRPDARILIATGFAEGEQASSLVSSRSVPVLRKPFSYEEFARHVHQMLA